MNQPLCRTCVQAGGAQITASGEFHAPAPAVLLDPEPICSIHAEERAYRAALSRWVRAYPGTVPRLLVPLSLREFVPKPETVKAVRRWLAGGHGGPVAPSAPPTRGDMAATREALLRAATASAPSPTEAPPCDAPR